MNKDDAFALIEKYIAGWKQNDFDSIASSLHSDCTIIESHGPVYYGINDIKLWHDLWLVAGSKVLKWDIITYYFCDKEITAFIEWDFECISYNVKYALPGVSIIKFSEGRIVYIHEYRMTKPAFDWDKKKLVSD